jgi:hypothetical protein
LSESIQDNKRGKPIRRTIDKRTQVGRRLFLKGTAAAVPAAAIAGAGISPQAAWAADAKALSPHAMATLVKMSRDIFPHDHIADSFYIAAVQPWDEKAAGNAEFRAMLEDGVTRLDADSQDSMGAKYLAVAWEADRVRLLQGIQHTPFFKKTRGDLVVSLYNQPEIWPKFGYEGSSAEHGGYIHRGFDDIDWLPSA